MPAYATIEDLRSQLGGAPSSSLTPEYMAKMMHPLPKAETVKREEFILKQCAGKRVLEFGASGPLHDGMVQVASQLVGVDKNHGPGVVPMDLDDIRIVPGDVAPVLGPRLRFGAPDNPMADYAPEIIICGEVIEHLSNPGWFLKRLREEYPDVPLIVTVPNAFARAGAKWLAKGLENVNIDHVAWYSPTTLSTLLSRAGYVTGALYYYNGDGPTAEGLVVCAE